MPPMAPNVVAMFKMSMEINCTLIQNSSTTAIILLHLSLSFESLRMERHGEIEKYRM